QLAAARKNFLNQAADWFDLSVSGHKSPSLVAKITSLFLVVFWFAAHEQATAGPEQRCHLVLGLTPFPTPMECSNTTAALISLLLTHGWDGPVTVVDPMRCRVVASMHVTNDALT